MAGLASLSIKELLQMPITEKECAEIWKFALCHQPSIQATQGFINYSHNSQNPKAILLSVKTLTALTDILKRIDGMNQQKPADERIFLRVAAGGKGPIYSNSYSVHGPTESDIILQLTGIEFSEFHEIDEENTTITVGPNVQVGDAEIALSKKGLSLSTSPLNPYVTLVGLAMYGGVGTGKDQPSFSGLLKRLKIMLYNGEIIDIDESSPDFATLMATNCGLLGIILRATFQCRRGNQLSLTETPDSIPAVLESIGRGLLGNAEYTSIFIAPDLSGKKHAFNARIYQWNHVSNQEPCHNSPTYLRHLWQQLQTTIVELLRIPQLLNCYPMLVPYFMRYILKPAIIGTTQTVSVGPAHLLFHHQTGYLQKGIEDVGWAIPDDGTGQQAKAALQCVLELLECETRKNPPRFLVTTGGIYVRYITGTPGGISMCQPKPQMPKTCLIDVVSNVHAPGFREFQIAATRSLEEKFGAKPHIGKYLPNGYQPDGAATFAEALNTFHKDHGISLERSPFLTNHFCTLLGKTEFSCREKQSAATTHDTHIPLHHVGACLLWSIKRITGLIAPTSDRLHLKF